MLPRTLAQNTRPNIIRFDAAFDAPSLGCCSPSSGPGPSPLPGNLELGAGPGEGAVRERSRYSRERKRSMDWVRDDEVLRASSPFSIWSGGTQLESEEDGIGPSMEICSYTGAAEDTTMNVRSTSKLS